VRRVDLKTEAVTNIPYIAIAGEGGAWDLNIASNGSALVSTRLNSIDPPLRRLDLGTETYSVIRPSVRSNTSIYRSADRTLFYCTCLPSTWFCTSTSCLAA